MADEREAAITEYERIFDSLKGRLDAARTSMYAIKGARSENDVRAARVARAELLARLRDANTLAQMLNTDAGL